MGKNKKQKKAKRKRPSGPRLDNDPTVGDVGPREPERNGGGIIALIVVGTTAVLGFTAYTQITQHDARVLEDKLFEERKSDTKRRKAQSAQVDSQSR